MNDRFLKQLVAALYIIEYNCKNHRKKYDEVKQKCIDENMEYVVPAYTVGRITFIANKAKEIREGLMKKYNVELAQTFIEKTVKEIYETVAIENNKNKNAPVCYVDDFQNDKNLPKYFVDSWLSVHFTYKMIFNNLQKTLEKYNVGLEKLDRAFNWYNDFFKKEILVIYEDSNLMKRG